LTKFHQSQISWTLRKTGAQYNNFLPLVIVLSFWFIVNSILFSDLGIKVVADSSRYIEYANGMMSGFYIEEHNFWYIGYAIYLLIIFELFAGSLMAAVIGQYVLSFLAVITIYKAAILLSKSAATSVVTCLLFIAFADIQQWSSYILAESVYTSFICFSIYSLAILNERKGGIIRVSIAVAVVTVTFFIKPTGIALLGALMGTICYELLSRILSRSTRLIIIFLSVALLLLLANSMMATYKIVENYVAGEVVYGVRSYAGESSIEGLTVSPPNDLHIPDSPAPIVQVVQFIVQNPLYWLKLFSLKVYYLLSHTRPFWSSWHNWYSILILVPSYILFLSALVGKTLDVRVKLFSAIFLLIHIFSVGVTSTDWDGRFLIPMLPVIFVLSGAGLNDWLTKFRNPALLHNEP
jgi:hypothetical protein